MFKSITKLCTPISNKIFPINYNINNCITNDINNIVLPLQNNRTTRYYIPIAETIIDNSFIGYIFLVSMCALEPTESNSIYHKQIRYESYYD